MIRPRNVRALVLAPVLGALVLVLLPVSYLHAALTRVRTRGRTGTTLEIPRRRVSDVDLAAIMRARRPVIVEGLGAASDVADLSAFRAVAATTDETIRVRFHDDGAPYFLYTGDYGRTHHHDEQMTLDAFLDLMFGRAPTATSTGPETDTHVETAVDRGTDTDVDPGSRGHEAGPEPGPPTGLCVYTLFGSADLGGAVGRMIDRIADGLGDEAPWPTARQASGIWIGSRGVVTPLHHDAWPGLLFQTHGSKRVTMFSPSDRTNLYFSPPTKVGSRWSRLPGRSADADPEQFPRIRRVARHEGELRAGDTLYIPPFWSHEIEALDANISIPFRFRVIPGDHLNPGYLRPAYEVFHGKYVRPLGHRSRRVRDAVGRARADTH